MSLQHKKASILLQDCMEKPWIHAPACLASHFLLRHLLFYLARFSPEDRGAVVFPLPLSPGGGVTAYLSSVRGEAARDEQKIHRCVSLFVPENSASI